MMGRREFLLKAAGALGALGAGLSLQGRMFPALAAIEGQMKITDVKTLQVGRHFVIVQIFTDAGIVGIGEATLEGRRDTMVAAVRDMRDYLIGKDPSLIEHHWQALYRHAFYRGGPVLNSAIGGIDIALWDIAGKALGRPIYKLLGGPTRQRIRVYGHIGGATVEQLIDSAKQQIQLGFTALKTSPPNPMEMVEGPRAIKENVTRLEKLRAAIGDDIDIAFDCHGRMSPPVAIAIAKAIEPLHILFYEEPVLPENVEAMAKVARETTIPIATGERLFTIWGFRQHFEQQIIDVAQPDVVHAGGISQLKKIAAMAEAYYVPLAPHNPLSPIATAACFQLDAAIPNFLIQETTISATTKKMRDSFVKESIEQIKDGHVELPTRPGLGIELDPEVEKKVPFNFAPTPAWFHRDGSVADW